MARRNLYLDHSATTPTDRRVVEAMLPFFHDDFGNASSSHGFGRRAERAVEDARESIAKRLNCQPKEIVFTSGGTESDNLALRGAAWWGRTSGQGSHIITTSIEHDAVIRTAQLMVETMGFELSLLPVDHCGKVDPDGLASLMRADTSAVSIIYANNEVGTTQAIRELANTAHAAGAVFHTDAVQAGGQLDLDVQALGVDLLSLSAHKFYGPKGVGLLYVRDGVELVASQSGGSHESYRRGGTYNTPGIVGMAAALDLAYDEFDQRTQHLRTIRDCLVDGILGRITDVELSGHPVDRLPSHASFVIDGVESNALLMHLDVKGVMASSGSACKTGNPEPSEVLLAMGYSHKQALGSLRLTVGVGTSQEDADDALDTLVSVVERLRRL